MSQCAGLAVRFAPKSRAPHSEPASLSPVEGLLVDIVADGFVCYCRGHRAEPNALVASYRWEQCIDLVTIRNFDRVTVARVPTHTGDTSMYSPPR